MSRRSAAPHGAGHSRHTVGPLDPAPAARPAGRSTAGAAAIVLLASLASGGALAGQASAGATAGQAPKEGYAVAMARSVVKRAPVVHERWDYTAGLVLDAIDRVAQRTNDADLSAYVKRNVDRLVRPDGTIVGYDSAELSLDQVEEAKIVLRLYERTHDQRYHTAAATIRRQLDRMPRTAEGGMWHKKIYPQQMWLDGVYMASPFYAAWGRAFQDPTSYEGATQEILLAARHLRDARTGLYYHGWDADHVQNWADKQTGLSPNFWGRGLGWFAMALVDVLDTLPEQHPDRGAVLALLQDLAPALERVQDPVTGLWWQVLDQPNRNGNYLETSASAMFVYTLARGANRGYLPARFRQVAERGFEGLVRERITANPDGTLSLGGICQVAGLGGRQQRDGSFDYYIHEPVVTDDYKGVGPFILDALELNR